MNCSVIYTGTSGSPPFACIDKVTRSKQHTITDPHIKLFDVQGPVSCTQLQVSCRFCMAGCVFHPIVSILYTLLTLSAKTTEEIFQQCVKLPNVLNVSIYLKVFWSSMHPTLSPLPPQPPPLPIPPVKYPFINQTYLPLNGSVIVIACTNFRCCCTLRNGKLAVTSTLHVHHGTLFIGASLSKPHTSVTALAEFVCLYVCGQF